MIHCTTPTKRFLLLQMLEWKVEMAACYHKKGGRVAGWGDSDACLAETRRAWLVRFNLLLVWEIKTLVCDIHLVNYQQLRLKCALRELLCWRAAAVLMSKCFALAIHCYSEQTAPPLVTFRNGLYVLKTPKPQKVHRKTHWCGTLKCRREDQACVWLVSPLELCAYQ